MSKEADVFYLFMSDNQATWARAKTYEEEGDRLSNRQEYKSAFGWPWPWNKPRIINNIPLYMVESPRELFDIYGNPLNRRVVVVNIDVFNNINSRVNDKTLSVLDVLKAENFKLRRQVNEMQKQLFGLAGGDKLHEKMQKSQKAYGEIRREGKDVFNPFFQSYGRGYGGGSPPAYGPSSED